MLKTERGLPQPRSPHRSRRRRPQPRRSYSPLPVPLPAAAGFGPGARLDILAARAQHPLQKGHPGRSKVARRRRREFRAAP